MVTAYYLMKMSKKKPKIEFSDYYSNLFKIVSKKKPKEKCRVCLQEDIEISEQDDYPKFLCETCYKFLKTAILFRQTAKQSEKTLRQCLKEEMEINHDVEDQSHDHSDDDNMSDIKSVPKWDDDDSFSNLKEEKKEKIKYAPKVTCNICNKIINRSYYKEHMTMHDPDHQKYVCEICGKFFRLRCAYHNHRVRHRNDFPYKCQFCPYRGRYAELLKNHMRTHTGDYRYMCTECPARFLFKSNLNSHIRKHKEPQFKCDTCKRAFHTKLTLQRHFEADHLGIKNHVCSMCGKAFGYRNAMMKHQRHVHKREKLLFGRMPSYLQAENKHHENV